MGSNPIGDLQMSHVLILNAFEKSSSKLHMLYNSNISLLVSSNVGVIFFAYFRRILRILGEQKRKRGDREGRVAREGKSAKKT